MVSGHSRRHRHLSWFDAGNRAHHGIRRQSSGRLYIEHLTTTSTEMSQIDDIGTTVERMVVDAYPDDTAPGAAVLLVKEGQILYRGESTWQISNTRFR